MAKGTGKQQHQANGKRLGGCTGKGWKPGQSGNPKGRPPGTTGPSLIAQLQCFMDDDDGLLDRGVGSRRWALVEALYAAALEGDMRAMRIIMDRTDPIKAFELVVNNNMANPTDGVLAALAKLNATIAIKKDEER